MYPGVQTSKADDWDGTLLARTHRHQLALNLTLRSAVATSHSRLLRPCFHSLVLSKHKALATRQHWTCHGCRTATFLHLLCLSLRSSRSRSGDRRSRRTSTSTAGGPTFHGPLSAAAASAAGASAMDCGDAPARDSSAMFGALLPRSIEVARAPSSARFYTGGC